MNGTARMTLAAALMLFTPGFAFAQADLRDTPPPLVTADREPFYLAGDPVMYAGNIYYPKGPQVHFRGNEMIRSGYHLGIPLYTRTTIEPFSIVYIPLAGGLMQPYERLRAGDIAGTVGSTTPSFPVVRSWEERSGEPRIYSAPSPITQTEELVPFDEPDMPAAPASTGMRAPTVTGTSGIVAAIAAVRPAPISPRRKAQTLNALFVEFDNRRWYSGGPAVEFDAARMTRIGEHHGFPVYADRPAQPATIYIPVTREAGGLVARYSVRQRR